MMIETEGKIPKKLGRPVTGRALSPAERMKAMRDRKRVLVAADRAAAGLPPPRTRKAGPAGVSLPVDATRIAQLEKEKAALEEDVIEFRRASQYAHGEIRRLESERDARGTSLLTGKEPARKHREAALAEWAAKDPWHGQENVKGLRTNVSRAITTLDNLKGIVAKFGAKLGYDADLLTKAMAVLGVYKAGMGHADAHAAHALREAEKALQAREQALRSRAAVNVFGTDTPAAADVRAMASDLIAYDAAAEEWLKKKHRTDSAYSSISSIHTLQSLLDKPAALRDELLRIATEMPGRGRHRTYEQRDNESCWFGGLDDFEAWRASRTLT